MYSMDAIVPRAWSINWRNSYEQSKNRVRSVMQVYLRERLWLYFYCATAPTASESAKADLRDGDSASSVGGVICWLIYSTMTIKKC